MRFKRACVVLVTVAVGTVGAIALPPALPASATAASSGLAIDTAAPDSAYGAALQTQPGTVIGSSFVTKPPQGTPDAVVTGPLAGFPTAGSASVLLTTGDANLATASKNAGSPGVDDGGPTVHGDSAVDVSILKVDLNVPSNVNCLVGFDFRFLSQEYPQFVGSNYNDAFVAELDKTTWTAVGSTINAPDNFAFDPNHHVISINSTGATSMTATEAADTTYGGATPVLSAATPITPGPHSLYLSIFDQGDHIYDSAVLADNLIFGSVAHPATDCVPGAKVAAKNTGLAQDALLGGGNPAGNISVACKAEPVNCATGEFWTTTDDLGFAGRGPSVQYTRTYSSAIAAAAGPFGYGWASTFGSHVEKVPGGARVHQENGSVVPFTSNPDGSYTPPPWAHVTLVTDPDGTLTYTRRKALVFRYNSQGLLTAISNLASDTTSIGYDHSGHLSSVTSGTGQVASLTTDATGRVTRLVDPAGRATGYSYDDNGNLAAVTDAAGAPTRYQYGAGHLLLKVIDPAGATVTNAYDLQSRVTQQTDPLGAVTGFSYGGTGSDTTTTITDAEGRVTTEDFTDGFLKQRSVGTGGAGLTTSYQVDPTSFATTAVTDGLGRTSRYAYDDDGNLTSVTRPDGGHLTATYDSIGDVTSVTDPLGQHRLYTYDSTGHLLTASAPTSVGTAVTKLTRDAAHPDDVTAVTDPLGRTSSFNYDANGLIVRVTNPLGDISTASHDAEGHVVRQVDAAGRTATAEYDALGRIVTASLSSGSSLHYAYDPDGRLVSTTDASGNVTTYTRDAAGRVVKVTRADGSSRTTAYDSQGRTVASTDAAGLVTRDSYDVAGLLVSAAGPQGTTTYTYDQAGQRSAARDPLGRTTGYRYNDLGQVTKISYSDGASPVTYSYDADGNRIGATDGTGQSTFSFDPSGKPLATTNGAGETVRYSYDLAGQPTALTYPGGQTVSRSFDADGRLTEVTDWRGKSFVFGYDADGLLTSQTAPNGVATTLSRDASGALTSEAVRRGSANVLSLTYGRDANELLSSESSSGMAAGGPQKYGHDALGRLISASQGGGSGGTSFTYDANNLITQMAGPGSHSTDLAYDPSTGALSTITARTGNAINSTAQFAYDASGNRTSETVGGASLTYGYSQAGMLTSYTGPAGGSPLTLTDSPAPPAAAAVHALYGYDSTGLRVTKTVGTTLTRYTYDTSGAVPAVLTAGQRQFVYGPVGPIEQVEPDGTAMYLHGDQLGSTRAVTDEAGKVLQTYDYSPYGAVRVKQGGGSLTVTALLFTGAYRDAESGLIYLHARNYDPATAQFLTADPLVGITHQAFAYANGTPLDIVDPLGLWGWGDTLGLISTTSGVLAVGLALTGVGAPFAVGLEIISVTTGVAAAGIDCSRKIDVTCGIDAAAASLGVAGGAFRVLGFAGKITKDTGELVDTAFGINAASIGFVGSTKSIAEALSPKDQPSVSPTPSSSASGTTPVSVTFNPNGPCLA